MRLPFRGVAEPGEIWRVVRVFDRITIRVVFVDGAVEGERRGVVQLPGRVRLFPYEPGPHDQGGGGG
jgi:hypothetical protein